jgi:hypothetical protein
VAVSQPGQHLGQGPPPDAAHHVADE